MPAGDATPPDRGPRKDVELYELAADVVAGAASTTLTRPELLRRVRQDMRQRTVLAGLIFVPTGMQRAARAIWIGAFFVVVVALSLYTFGIRWPGVIGVAAVLAVAGMGFEVWRNRRRVKRLDASSGNGAACPHCGYPLIGLPEPIPARFLAGLRTGPRLCPECGEMWPLVPRYAMV